MDDDSFKSIFRPVIGKIMETFSPGAVVLQCGADSLSGDRLGCFNLSLRGNLKRSLMTAGRLLSLDTRCPHTPISHFFLALSRVPVPILACLLPGHADCVEFVKTFNVPTLVLGGGGYTLRNVPRCWTYETAVLLGVDIKDALPYNDYFEYYGPDYRLHMPVSNMENLNTKEYLENVKVSDQLPRR